MSKCDCEMTEQVAREILGEWIKGGDDLCHGSPYIDIENGSIVLDGLFAFDEIEAILWWVENMQPSWTG